MHAIVEVFNTGNVDAVPSLFADDYVDHQGLEGIEIRGPKAFARSSPRRAGRSSVSM
jgi:hypothetical protein